MRKTSTATAAAILALTGVISFAAPALAVPESAPGLGPGVFAFVVNSDAPHGQNGSLAVIDTATGRTERVISQGLGVNPESVAVSPDARTAYVAGFGDVTQAATPQELAVLDIGSGHVVGRVPVGIRPVQVVLSRDGARVYVVNSGSVTDLGSVSVIDTKSLSVTDVITAEIDNPAAMALTPDGSRAYVTDQSSGRVTVIDTSDDRTTGTIPLERDGQSQPTGIVIASDGRHAYVAQNATGSVAVIDTVSDTVVGAPVRLPGFGMPYGLALTPDDSRLYVTEAGSDEVAVVDTATGVPRPTTVRVGRNPTAVAVTPDGKTAYVTSASDDRKGISVIDTSTETVTASLNSGSSPFAVAFAVVPGAAG